MPPKRTRLPSPHPISDQERFLEQFSLCESIFNEDGRNEISRKYANDPKLAEFIQEATKLHSKYTILREQIDGVEEDGMYANVLSYLLSNYRMVKEKGDISALLSALYTLNYYFSGITTKLAQSFKLDNTNAVSSALDDYIAIGKAIRKAETYNLSNMKKVDEFVSDPIAFFKKYRKALKLPTLDFNFDKTFVALAAPSLEGKTQSAFTLTSAYPLYFVMAAAVVDDGRLQPIYKAFTEHSWFLYRYANADLNMLGLSEGSAPTAHLLLDIHKRTPLQVLGFFLKIMRQAVAKKKQLSENEEFDWMNFYARQLTPIYPTSISIEKFLIEKELLGESFCVFLDEFLTSKWSVFVRNLARAVGLGCVVANTNINIVNLVSTGAAMSRSGDCSDSIADSSTDNKDDKKPVFNPNSWSLVFRRLDNLSKDVLDISDRLERIRARCSAPEGLDLVFGDWFYKCRAGIAIWIWKAMDDLLGLWDEGKDDSFVAHQRKEGKFAIGKEYSVASILCYLLKDVSYNLAFAKSQMAFSFNGEVAKLGLLTDAAFRDCAPVEETVQIFKYVRFIESHLYYITNPNGMKLDFFLTFKPCENESSLSIIWEEETNLDDNDFECISTNWKLQSTTFREDESLTFLACLAIQLDASTSSILQHACIGNIVSNNSIQTFWNSKAFKLSRNNLEVAAAMAIVDASQHTSGVEPQFSLHGQDGLTWLNNIVANCSHSVTFRNTKLIIEDAGLINWLQTLRIPFLYGINHGNEMLDQLTALASTVNSDDGTRVMSSTEIFTGQYFGSHDKARIDGYFEFVQCAEGGVHLSMQCAVECKNLSNPADARTLKDLINSAMTGARIKPRRHQDRISNLPHLFLIFTDDVKNPGADSDLSSLCVREKINLYRISPASGNYDGTLNLAPHHPQWKLHDSPQTVGLIIELEDTKK